MAGAKIALTDNDGELQADIFNKAEVNLPLTETEAGYGLASSLVDEGVITGNRSMRALYATEDYRLAVGIDSQLFNLSFEGTIIARDKLSEVDAVSMVAAQTGGFLVLNSGAVLTTLAGTLVRSYRSFAMTGSANTWLDQWVKIGNATTSSNAQTDFGLGYATVSAAQVIAGVFFRINTSGVLQAIVTNNSVDISTTAIDTTNIPPHSGVGSFDFNDPNHYAISWQQDTVTFWINTVVVAVYTALASFGTAAGTSSLPLFSRIFNTSATSVARQTSIAFLGVTQSELNVSKPFGHIMAGMGRGAYQMQEGNTSGGSVTRGAAPAGWPTSGTAQAAGTWTATSAPAVNSLGGLWISPAISTLTSSADYPVFAYQNPTGSETLPAKTLYITSVRWGRTVVLTAASTNTISLTYLVGVGSTSSATNNSDGIATLAARGIALDVIPFKANAALSDSIDGGYLDLSAAPLVVPAGSFLHFIVRPRGTVASNTLVITSTVAFNGYFE